MGTLARLCAGGLVIALLVTTRALAAPAPPGIVLREVPGTNGEWHEGIAIVSAPAATVRQWQLDVRRWPQLYPDTTSAELLGTLPNGEILARFKSTIVGRTLTLRMRPTPSGYTYTGHGRDVTTQGRAYFIPLSANQTRVVLQSTSQLHGAARFFIGAEGKRKRAYRKLASDLQALQRFAQRPVATRLVPYPRSNQGPGPSTLVARQSRALEPTAFPSGQAAQNPFR